MLLFDDVTVEDFKSGKRGTVTLGEFGKIRQGKVVTEVRKEFE